MELDEVSDTEDLTRRLRGISPKEQPSRSFKKSGDVGELSPLRRSLSNTHMVKPVSPPPPPSASIPGWDHRGRSPYSGHSFRRSPSANRSGSRKYHRNWTPSKTTSTEHKKEQSRSHSPHANSSSQSRRTWEGNRSRSPRRQKNNRSKNSALRMFLFLVIGLSECVFNICMHENSWFS